MTTAPVRFSNLKAMSKSPAHYRYYVDRPESERGEQSTAMRLGSAVDALTFGHRGVIGWSGIRRGKAWDEFREVNERDGTIILNDTEMTAAHRMRDQLERHRDAWTLLQGGVTQHTMEWSIDGVACAGTPDAYDLTRVVDLKTSRTSEPRAFMRHATQMNYHTQLAWYRHGIGLQQAPLDTNGTLPRPRECWLVVVESSPPWPVVVYKATGRLLDAGDATWRRWLDRLISCEASGEWPTYEAPGAALGEPVSWDIDNGIAASLPDPEWMRE